jgi:ABC-2 type transport system ATP-binding protein
LPPADTFELLARIYELDSSFFFKRKNELIELFELKDFIHTPTRKLSLGQRMRCEIAASLLHKPKVIFLDEPTIGLDPVAKSTIRELISRANKEEKVTVFLTSHDAGDIERLCKRVIIINHGQVIFDDSTNRLRREFLRKKEIDLKLTNPWQSEIDLEGVEISKSKGFGMKLSVDLTLNSIDRVVGEILKKRSVEDITIQNLPMEEIIADIYKRQEAP